VVGLAGGILLLAVLLLFFDPLVAIPLHGVVQLASNVSRAYLQRAHVERALVARFAWLLLPAGLVGIAIARRIEPEVGRVAIGLFVLLATWLPSALRLPTAEDPSRARRRFVVAGGLVGFANVLVGATGPVVAPFVLSLPVSRQGVVGTLAACQTLGHLVKVALFAGIGFSFHPYALPLLGLCLGALAGSWLGTRALARLDERLFRHLIRLALTLLALHLIGRVFG
jgi:uncharacterized membrane protein YfcA